MSKYVPHVRALDNSKVHLSIAPAAAGLRQESDRLRFLSVEKTRNILPPSWTLVGL